MKYATSGQSITAQTQPTRPDYLTASVTPEDQVYRVLKAKGQTGITSRKLRNLKALSHMSWEEIENHLRTLMNQGRATVTNRHFWPK